MSFKQCARELLRQHTQFCFTLDVKVRAGWLGEGAWNPSTWQVVAGTSGVQGQPQLHTEYEASLGYETMTLFDTMRPLFKNKSKRNKKKQGRKVSWKVASTLGSPRRVGKGGQGWCQSVLRSRSPRGRKEGREEGARDYKDRDFKVTFLKVETSPDTRQLQPWTPPS